MGYLAGRVTIGPLRPAERLGQPEAPAPPGAYAARPVRVFTPDGRLIATAAAGPDGAYRLALAPGTYRVEIGRLGIDRARGLPASIDVQSGQTTRLDIDVDTGLR